MNNEQKQKEKKSASQRVVVSSSQQYAHLNSKQYTNSSCWQANRDTLSVVSLQEERGRELVTFKKYAKGRTQRIFYLRRWKKVFMDERGIQQIHLLQIKVQRQVKVKSTNTVQAAVFVTWFNEQNNSHSLKANISTALLHRLFNDTSFNRAPLRAQGIFLLVCISFC